jgi:mRNA interferase MazF
MAVFLYDIISILLQSLCLHSLALYTLVEVYYLIFKTMEDILMLYDQWNIQKKALSKSKQRYLFKEGEIWWCSLGLNVGTESFGKGETFRRPVLILKKLSSETCIALPLTSKEKNGSWFVDIPVKGEVNWVMLYQIRMIHIKRFQRRLSVLEELDFLRVKEKLETLLELSDNHLTTGQDRWEIPKVITLYDEDLENAIAEYGRGILFS